jgi:hypothetical protein
MRLTLRARSVQTLALTAVLACLGVGGCQALLEHMSNRLTHWQMLGDEALDDPVKAVGGAALAFVPSAARPWRSCRRRRRRP